MQILNLFRIPREYLKLRRNSDITLDIVTCDVFVLVIELIGPT
jgi:hypothetical protein